MAQKKPKKLLSRFRKLTAKIKIHPKIKVPLARLAPFLALIALLALAYFKKDWFIVALVNKHPISRAEFNRHLQEQYGQQALETMVNQKLIEQEAKKSQVQVSDQEVEENIKKIEEGLQGKISLDDLLKAQGMTREELEKGIRLQLTVEKLIGKDIKISDEEINDYLKNNRELLSATQEADQKEEAKENILRQKINENFQKWIENLRQKAQILRFI